MNKGNETKKITVDHATADGQTLSWSPNEFKPTIFDYVSIIRQSKLSERHTEFCCLEGFYHIYSERFTNINPCCTRLACII